MTPPPHHTDSQNRAEDLAGVIVSAASPPQISAAISAVESFLHRHASDQSRSFFSVAFPSLVCRIFGFDDPSPPSSRRLSSTGWIDQAASASAASGDLASRLFNLLSPDGVLISSISSVDRHGLLKYVFPIERLPDSMRLALQSERYLAVISDLCPLFKGRVKEDNIHGHHQIQLNVFEYFIFWFAYYPVCKGSSESSDPGFVRRRFRLENWTSSLPVIGIAGHRPRPRSERECSLYLRLLYAYLHAFVPKCGLGSCQPYRSSLLHYSSNYDGCAFMQAEFLVHTLVHFWMVDNDFSPVPVNLHRQFGISFPNRAVRGETPPTAGLAEVLKLLVMYLNCGVIAPTEGNDQMVYDGSPLLKSSSRKGAAKSRSMLPSSENPVGSWNSVMKRPLYRFILRTFLFCPLGASMKNATQVFSLWVCYLAPWKTQPEDFPEFNLGAQNLESSSQLKDKEGNGKSQIDCVYTPSWQGYVLTNYLFYSSLVVHFLGFAHKFLHANLDSVIQMVSQLLNILTSSKELLDLLHNVDAAYHSKPVRSSSSNYAGLYKYVPSIREQLQDWEDGLCESDADGSFLHENWNHDLKLFSDGEDGAHKLLQLFVLRAQHEIQAVSGDITQNLQALASIRSQMNIFFGGSASESHSLISPEEAHGHAECSEVFTPKRPNFGRRQLGEVKYKGDWMQRPISDAEVAWLARLLIKLSNWLNEALGLNLVDNGDSSSPTYVEIIPDETGHVGGPKEVLWMAVSLVVSWLGLFGCSVVRFMRWQGLRINLRVLASKKFVIVLAFYVVFCGLKRALRLIF